MIITDEKILRMKCEDAKLEEIGSITEQLEKELAHSGRLGYLGIGLSAPQINIHKNIAIVRIDSQYKVNLVNCKITKSYDKTLFKDEGCLSFRDRLEDTIRYQEIYITDNLVYPHSFIATGLMAVVIQHELDHLNGILLPDNAIKKELKIRKRLRPNDICDCGSLKKYKRCCMEK